MTQYNVKLRTRRLYKCNNCFAIYENRERAERCHDGDVVIFSVEMKRLKDYRKRGSLK